MSERATPEIDIEDVAAHGSGVLADVREPDDYVAGHVPGAVPIPMSQLANRVGEIDKTLLYSSSAPRGTGASR